MTNPRVATRTGELRSGRTPHVLVTVVRTEPPTSARPGDQALVLPDGTIEGFVGGVCAESTTRAESLRRLATGEAGVVRIAGEDNPCASGGALELFLDPVLPPRLVVVLGDGPMARALADVGTAVGHEVRRCEVVPEAFPPDTAAVVAAAHGRADEPALLTRALRAGVPYVALVASRRRAAAVLARVDAPDVGRVHAPAGLDLGAATPGEVALSVHAEIVALARAAGAEPEPSEGAAVAPPEGAGGCCHG